MPSKRPSDERTRLAVDVTSDSIAVKREDDAPIQVEYRSKSERFINIFEKPVTQLAFLKGHSQDQWIAEAEELAIKSTKGLLSFLYHVYLIAEPRLRELNSTPDDN